LSKIERHLPYSGSAQIAWFLLLSQPPTALILAQIFPASNPRDDVFVAQIFNLPYRRFSIGIVAITFSVRQIHHPLQAVLEAPPCIRILDSDL
jgi:hypothetical protein